MAALNLTPPGPSKLTLKGYTSVLSVPVDFENRSIPLAGSILGMSRSILHCMSKYLSPPENPMGLTFKMS
jgi:hypothetical protein